MDLRRTNNCNTKVLNAVRRIARQAQTRGKIDMNRPFIPFAWHFLIAPGPVAPTATIACGPSQHRRVATGNHYRPFTDKNLLNNGFTKAIARRAFAKVGVTISIDWLSWPRARGMTKKSRCHGALPSNRSPAREDACAFSCPITTYDNVAFVRTDAVRSADTVPEIPNGTYCGPHGYADFAPLIRRREAGDFRRRRPRAMATCLKFLAHGRTDLVLAPGWQGRRTARETFGQNVRLRTQSVMFKKTSDHLIISKRRDEAGATIACFNRSLKILKERGAYRRLLRHHLPDLIAADAIRGDGNATVHLKEETQALWIAGGH